VVFNEAPDRETRYAIGLTLSNGIINNSAFKHKIKSIINEYRERGYISFQGLVWLFRNGARETSAFGGW